jgi:hypothetical protein
VTCIWDEYIYPKYIINGTASVIKTILKVIYQLMKGTSATSRENIPLISSAIVAMASCFLFWENISKAIIEEEFSYILPAERLIFFFIL